MSNLIVYLNAAFFALMGIYALVWPNRVMRIFGQPSIPADARNEVRAVYGGFGVFIGAILLAASRFGELREGILWTVAVALLGMAAGRLISFVIEPTVGPYPKLFLLIEVVLAITLIAATRIG